MLPLVSAASVALCRVQCGRTSIRHVRAEYDHRRIRLWALCALESVDAIIFFCARREMSAISYYNVALLR